MLCHIWELVLAAACPNTGPGYCQREASTLKVAQIAQVKVMNHH